MTIWRAGMKAVCIDDYSEPGDPGPRATVGTTYTVSAVYFEEHEDSEGPEPFLDFVELKARRKRGWCNGFSADCFRPAVEKKTDTGMAILKSILEDAKNFKVKENADA